MRGGVEVGGIGVEVGKRLGNSIGRAIDGGQSRRAVNGAVAIGGFDERISAA